jgi:CHASE1-domain containing sensor protein
MIDTKQKIIDRIEMYENFFDAALGLHHVSSSIDQGEWTDFWQTTNLFTNYEGMLGIGYAIVLRPENKNLYPAQIYQAADDRFNELNRKDPYTSILYLEPLHAYNKKAIGFDMFSEANRREAMSAARDKGTMKITGPVSLIQDDHDDEIVSVLAYKAHYPIDFDILGADQTEKQKKLKGFVYGAFRTEELFGSILAAQIINRQLPFMTLVICKNMPCMNRQNL